MFAAINWDSISVAGSFLIGSVFGTVVTMRVLRIAITLTKKVRDDET